MAQALVVVGCAPAHRPAARACCPGSGRLRRAGGAGGGWGGKALVVVVGGSLRRVPGSAQVSKFSSAGPLRLGGGFRVLQSATARWGRQWLADKMSCV